MTSTTETYFLMVLEARNLKPKCWQGHTSSKGFRGGSPLTSSGFWWPWAFLQTFPIAAAFLRYGQAGRKVSMKQWLCNRNCNNWGTIHW